MSKSFVIHLACSTIATGPGLKIITVSDSRFNSAMKFDSVESASLAVPGLIENLMRNPDTWDCTKQLIKRDGFEVISYEDNLCKRCFTKKTHKKMSLCIDCSYC